MIGRITPRRTRRWHLVGATIIAVCLPGSAVVRADSPYLYGIHWWGYTQGQGVDNVPCQMLDCTTHGGWTVETVLTHSASWWGPAYFTGLYTDLYGNKNMSIITRIDYDWGQTVPAPSNPNYANWPNDVVGAVNTLRHGSHLWVLGNEPNIVGEGTTWPNSQVDPAGYATIYRNVRSAVHAQAQASPAGPHRVLIAAPSPGGVIPGVRWMDGNQWLGQVIDNVPADEIDGFALHAYGGGVSGFHSGYTSQLNLIDSKGLQQKPVYITEWNMVATEQAMAQFIRDSFADLNTWNQTPGHHNIVCLCWFVYDSDQQAGGGWNNYAIEWYRNNGIPLGDPNDVWTAFEQTVDLRYPAGQIGTPGVAMIAVNPASFNRAVFEGDGLASDSFTVRNSGNTNPMSYDITDNASWLSVDPVSGSSAGENDTIAIDYNTGFLADGNYTGTITVTAASASNSPRTVTVNLTVNPSPFAPVDFDKDGDVDLDDYGKFQACYSGAGLAQNDPACAAARLDGDSDVDPDDFGIFQGCLTGANIPADPGCAD